MTQAANLAQLANRVNASGQLDGANGVSGTVPSAAYATNAGNADLLDGLNSTYFQPASSAITTSNIGSQSVNYANSAGNGGVTSVNSKTGAVETFTTLSANINGYTQSISGIPSWAKRITISLRGVSKDGADDICFYLGSNFSVESTSTYGTTGASTQSSLGTEFILLNTNTISGEEYLNGNYVLQRVTSLSWIGSGVIGAAAGNTYITGSCFIQGPSTGIPTISITHVNTPNNIYGVFYVTYE